MDGWRNTLYSIVVVEVVVVVVVAVLFLFLIVTSVIYCRCHCLLLSSLLLFLFVLLQNTLYMIVLLPRLLMEIFKQHQSTKNNNKPMEKQQKQTVDCCLNVSVNRIATTIVVAPRPWA